MKVRYFELESRPHRVITNGERLLFLYDWYIEIYSTDNEELKLINKLPIEVPGRRAIVPISPYKSGFIIADGKDKVYILNNNGEPLARIQMLSDVVTLSASEDGKEIVVCTRSEIYKNGFCSACHYFKLKKDYLIDPFDKEWYAEISPSADVIIDDYFVYIPHGEQLHIYNKENGREIKSIRISACCPTIQVSMSKWKWITEYYDDEEEEIEKAWVLARNSFDATFLSRIYLDRGIDKEFTAELGKYTFAATLGWDEDDAEIIAIDETGKIKILRADDEIKEVEEIVQEPIETAHYYDRTLTALSRDNSLLVINFQ